MYLFYKILVYKPSSVFLTIVKPCLPKPVMPLFQPLLLNLDFNFSTFMSIRFSDVL